MFSITELLIYACVANYFSVFFMASLYADLDFPKPIIGWAMDHKRNRILMLLPPVGLLTATVSLFCGLGRLLRRIITHYIAD